MRLSEVDAIERDVHCTKEFQKDAQRLSSKAGVSDAIHRFVDWKKTSSAPFGKKDYRFKGDGALKGLWHAHVIFGKVIALYDITPGGVYLCRLVDHDMLDGARQQVPLATYVRSLSDRDYSKCFASRQHSMRLSDDEISEIRALLYDIAANDVEIIHAFINGDSGPLMDFLILCTPEELKRSEQEDIIYLSFGGRGHLTEFAKAVLRHIGAQ